MKPRLSYFPAEGGRGQGRLEESVRQRQSHAQAQKDPLSLWEQRVLGQFTLGPLKVAGASWASGLEHTPLWAGSWP